MSTKIMSCTCKHEAQDEIYGSGVRLFNKTRKMQGTVPMYRCTVCLKLVAR